MSRVKRLPRNAPRNSPRNSVYDRPSGWRLMWRATARGFDDARGMSW